MAGTNVEILGENNFQEFISNNDVPVLVDFWAEWCGPCRMIAPVVEEVAAEYANQLRVGKLNVDENQAITNRFQVSSIPTLIIFKGGREVERSIGFKTKKELKRLIEKHLS